MIFMKVLANPRAQKPWHGILEELRRMKKLKRALFGTCLMMLLHT